MRAHRSLALVLAVLLAAHGARALPPDFPLPPPPTTREEEPFASVGLPTGPFADGKVPVRPLEGRVIRSVWQLDATGRTTLDLLEPLRAALERAGYGILFQCETKGCGGFDFRFDAGVLPEPRMHVDLGDFRFLSATDPGTAPGTGPGAGGLSLMVSRSADTGYVQVTEVLPAEGARPGAAAVLPPPLPDPGLAVREPVAPVSEAVGTTPDADPSTLGQTLLAMGAVTLDGLDFGSGSSDLTEGKYASLEALADWLSANPDRSVTLVGHTDSSGSLDGNIALSRRRAASVRDRMVRLWSIAPARIDAEGVGPLAPRDSNLTDAGRTRNRRVEAILIPPSP